MDTIFRPTREKYEEPDPETAEWAWMSEHRRTKSNTETSARRTSEGEEHEISCHAIWKLTDDKREVEKVRTLSSTKIIVCKKSRSSSNVWRCCKLRFWEIPDRTCHKIKQRTLKRRSSSHRPKLHYSAHRVTMSNAPSGSPAWSTSPTYFSSAPAQSQIFFANQSYCHCCKVALRTGILPFCTKRTTNN